MIRIPLDAARQIALHTQQLTHAEPPPATHASITALAEQLGAIQIDTIHKVQRSQYLVVWSRFGTYDTAVFDDLIFTPGKRTLFEYWKKAASIIPLSEYAVHTAYMAHQRDNPSGWWQRKFFDKATADEVLDHVRARIREEGPLRTADFKGERESQWSGWAAWKPAKFALEWLFRTGELMIADREAFHRVYDLAERVRPDHIDTTPHTMEQHRRYILAQAARSAGIAEAEGIIDYAYMKRTPARPILADLIEAGVLQEAAMETVSGEWVTALYHQDNADLIQQARDGGITADRTTFLSFFDSLFWPGDRDQKLWGFHNLLEAYKKREDRRWGYFCLPILHRDKLIGRFDPTLDRKTGRLTIHALYLENAELSDELIAAVAAAMRDFIAFHNATDLVIEASDPPEYAAQLVNKLSS